MLKHVIQYPKIDSTLKSIVEASPKKLRNIDFVKNLIRSIGLYGANFEVYGNEVRFGTHDETGVWQEPTQSAKFLIWLSKQNIKNMLEIGSWNGCWALFMAVYLSKFGLMKAISVDIKDTVLPTVKFLGSLHNIKFIQGSSINFIGQEFDFVFIDGGRDYPIVEGHWNNVGKYAKICAFHDINCRFAPDIGEFWSKIKKINDCIELLDHPKGYGYDIMGIGIVKCK
jgi:hypothetical protein